MFCILFIFQTRSSVILFMISTPVYGCLIKTTFPNRYTRRRKNPRNPVKKEEKVLPVEKVTVKELFEQFEIRPPKDMAPLQTAL